MKSTNQKKKVAVIGAGVAGASAAYVLNRDGFDVSVFESSAAVGGRCRSITKNGFTIDIGAVYLLNLYSRTIALLEEAGYNDLQDWSPPGALIDSKGQHIIRYDFLPSFMTLRPLSLADKLRMLWTGLSVMLRPAPRAYETDSLAAFDDGQQNMETWSRRSLGDRVHEYLVRPWIEPAFGVGVEKLSPQFLQGVLKNAYKAKFKAPKGGMGDISKALLNGIQVELNNTVDTIKKLDNGDYSISINGETQIFSGVVLATPAKVSASILSDVAEPDTLQLFDEAPYAHMASIALGYHKDPWPNAKFDLALPVGAGDQPVVGIILHNRKSPQNVPNGGQLLNVFMNDKATRGMDEERLKEFAINRANAWMGGNHRPDFIEYNLHAPALAYAPPGHYAKMQTLRRAMPHGLMLAGDYLAHLGVETAVVSGERAGIELGRYLHSF